MPAHTVAARVPATKPPLLPLRGPFAAAARSDKPPSSLVIWYLGLIPHWTGAQPRLKVRLLLRTHQWIVDRILAPEVSLAAAAADLRPDGDLTRILTDLVPDEDSQRWRQFIRVLVANLRHALLLPVTRRNEAWVRWLFLIPYSVKECSAAVPGAPPLSPDLLSRSDSLSKRVGLER